MDVNSWFLKDLNDLDEELQIGWNSIKERFQIVRNDIRMKGAGVLENKLLLYSANQPYFVLTVENDDGSFRDLDSRTIDKLRSIDLYRYSDIDDFLNEIEAEEDTYKKKQEIDFSEQIQEITKENRRRLADAFEDMRSVG